MTESFTFVGSKVGHELESIVTAGIATVGIVLLGLIVAASNRAAQENLTPSKDLSLRNVFELIAQMIRSIGDTAMGTHNRKYLPFLCSLFVYLLVLNLLGLIPGVTMPTHSVWFNAGIATVAFLLFNIWGIKEIGIVNYFKHLWGPFYGAFLPIGLLVFMIELTSLFIRPVSLTLRLFGNMTADHSVLSIFHELTKNIYVPIPVIFYFMGLLVCFIQAFVFTLLTMIYIGLATHHEDDHHAESGH
jgi:F-type H+-transporting ATPase subunit a